MRSRAFYCVIKQKVCVIKQYNQAPKCFNQDYHSKSSRDSGNSAKSVKGKGLTKAKIYLERKDSSNIKI